MIRDDESAGFVTRSEFLIAKYASKSKLNKRNGSKGKGEGSKCQKCRDTCFETVDAAAQRDAE